MDKTRIVVGASGSTGSLAAVRWAAAEARLRDSELRVVVAYQRRPSGVIASSQAANQAETAKIMHEAVAAARAIAPACEVRGVALPGYAVPALLHAAEEAALLVVGDHGGGRMFGAPTDSVAAQVATQARCSVVVVRGTTDRADGPVVVGVDDDPAADAIIGRAFEEAALRGAPVVAVTAGPASPDTRLEQWQAKFRSVPAQHEYVDGRPDKVMVDSCRQARLAVVGPRRHGYQGVLLGAVGTRLLRRSDCPVLIAR
ncbi:universal stress protein [Actinoplanes sp. NPDC026619]|uniref:universal stress protein n=1 Tax=Actinoplanes sp. NPDC026619 TaxID=3155798 RepID=UPI00340E24F2